MGCFSKFVTGVDANIRKLNYPKILLLLLLPFFLGSCHKKEKTSADYSETFSPIFVNTTHFFDANRPAQAIYYLDTSIIAVKGLTANDRFRFYGFHYVYSQKNKTRL